MKGLTKEEVKELWNILNTKQDSLLNELANVENLMLILELRSGMELSTKIWHSRLIKS